MCTFIALAVILNEGTFFLANWSCYVPREFVNLEQGTNQGITISQVQYYTSHTLKKKSLHRQIHVWIPNNGCAFWQCILRYYKSQSINWNLFLTWSLDSSVPGPSPCSLLPARYKVLAAAVFSACWLFWGWERQDDMHIELVLSLFLCVQFSITITEFDTLLNPQLRSPDNMGDGLLPTAMGESRLSPWRLIITAQQVISRLISFACAEHRYYLKRLKIK